MLRWLIWIISGEIICESSNWQHTQRLKITILGANWQLFRLERIAKCSYFILSVDTKHQVLLISFVMKIKKFMLPIWWYNRGWFPLGNKYLGSSFWMGYVTPHVTEHILRMRSHYLSRPLPERMQQDCQIWRRPFGQWAWDDLTHAQYSVQWSEM